MTTRKDTNRLSSFVVLVFPFLPMTTSLRLLLFHSASSFSTFLNHSNRRPRVVIWVSFRLFYAALSFLKYQKLTIFIASFWYVLILILYLILDLYFGFLFTNKRLWLKYSLLYGLKFLKFKLHFGFADELCVLWLVVIFVGCQHLDIILPPRREAPFWWIAAVASCQMATITTIITTLPLWCTLPVLVLSYSYRHTFLQ